MLDLKLIRNDPEQVREALRRRGAGAEEALDKLAELDRLRREVLVGLEERSTLPAPLPQAVYFRCIRPDQPSALRSLGLAMRALADSYKW